MLWKWDVANYSLNQAVECSGGGQFLMADGRQTHWPAYPSKALAPFAAAVSDLTTNHAPALDHLVSDNSLFDIGTEG